eukprot:TRINITY_DN9798_c0_g1_i1.p1 TRINITY_DN9798_c0_g1~~TRINITY_DN9798_c0_g1_i1.p1  ORF type:complete len:593 (+),score=129.31 TRINITY_DN9798_c0_g1_i1:58-1836(+)
MDAEEEEMLKLRGTKHYNQHTAQYGIRSIDANKSGTDYLSHFLPTSFGKKRKNDDNDQELFEKTKKRKVQPAKPVDKVPKKKKEDEPWYVFGKNMPPEPQKPKQEETEEAEVDTEVLELNRWGIPCSHEIIFKAHEKAVSTIALDPSGSRVLSGGYDYSVKFWDFAGMDERLKSFRSIEPKEGYPIRTLKYSLTGDKFLVISSSPQAKIYDRDGFELKEFVKGYMYLTDMAQTKGHVASLTDGCWHATESNLILTASADSTIRIWDINNEKTQKAVIKIRNLRGLNKNPVSSVTMSNDGKKIIAASQDGGLHAFPGSGPYNKSTTVKGAHRTATDTSCVAISADGYTVLSRGGDDTLKVCDLRNFTKPLAQFEDLPNFYPESDCIFSPNDDMFLTGTSVKTGEGTGLLRFYNKKTLTPVKQIGISQGSVISIIWHPKLNQILCGCSDNEVHVLYDPEISTNGALLSVKRRAKRSTVDDLELERPVHNPHALPMFKPPPSRRRQRQKEQADPVKSRRPEAPQIGPGSKGRIGSSVTAHIMKSLVNKDALGEDPREAILNFAKQAKEKPFHFAAYEKTQPKPIFDYSKDEDEQT